MINNINRLSLPLVLLIAELIKVRKVQSLFAIYMYNNIIFCHYKNE